MIFFLTPYSRYIVNITWIWCCFFLIACGKKSNQDPILNLDTQLVSKGVSCKDLNYFYNLCEIIRNLKAIKENDFFIPSSYSKQNIQSLISTFQVEGRPIDPEINLDVLFDFKVLLVGGTNDQLSQADLNHLLDYILFLEQLFQETKFEEISFVWDQNLSVSDFKLKTKENSLAIQNIKNFILKILNQVQKYHKDETIFSYLIKVKSFIDKNREELMQWKDHETVFGFQNHQNPTSFLETDFIELNRESNLAPNHASNHEENGSMIQKILDYFPTQNSIKLAASVIKLLWKQEENKGALYFANLGEIFLKTSLEERDHLISNALNLYWLWDQLSRYVLSVEIAFRSSNWDLNQGIHYKVSENQQANMIDFFHQLKEIVNKAYLIIKDSLTKRNPRTFKNEDITNVIGNIFQVINENDHQNITPLTEREVFLSEYQKKLLGLDQGSETISSEGKQWIQSWEKIPFPLHLIREDENGESLLSEHLDHSGLLNEFGILQLEALKIGFDLWYDTQEYLNQSFLIYQQYLWLMSSLPEGTFSLPERIDFEEGLRLSKINFNATLSSFLNYNLVSFDHDMEDHIHINHDTKNPNNEEFFATLKTSFCYENSYFCTEDQIFALPFLWNKKMSFNLATAEFNGGFDYSLRDLSFLNFYRSIITPFLKMNNEYLLKKTKPDGRVQTVKEFLQNETQTSLEGSMGKCELALLLLDEDQLEEEDLLGDCSDFIEDSEEMGFERGGLSFLRIVFSESHFLPKLYQALNLYADLFLPSSNGDNRISVSETTQMILYFYSAHSAARLVNEAHCKQNEISALNCNYSLMRYGDLKDVFWDLTGKTHQGSDGIVDLGAQGGIGEEELIYSIGGLNRFLYHLKSPCNGDSSPEENCDDFESFKLHLEKWIQPKEGPIEEVDLVEAFIVLHFLETFFLKWDQNSDGSIQSAEFLNFFSKMPQVRESIRTICLRGNDTRFSELLQDLKDNFSSEDQYDSELYDRRLEIQVQLLDELNRLSENIPLLKQSPLIERYTSEFNRIDILEVGYLLNDTQCSQ